MVIGWASCRLPASACGTGSEGVGTGVSVCGTPTHSRQVPQGVGNVGSPKLRAAYALLGVA